METTRHFGLIGFPLEHSFSPGWFSHKFEVEGISDAHYDLFPMEDLSTLRNLVETQNLLGFNITIPHKETILPFLDTVSQDAEAIGAVNCVKIIDGKWHGYNTDAFGFRKSLLSLLHGTEIKQALVLGTGGSSLAIRHVLQSLNISYRTVSQSGNGDLSYNGLSPSLLRTYDLIVNCTPVGLHPNADTCPDLPYEALTNSHFLFDLIYNPSETLFLKRGSLLGARVKNGQEMLELQAQRSWEIWST